MEPLLVASGLVLAALLCLWIAVENKAPRWVTWAVVASVALASLGVVLLLLVAEPTQHPAF